MEHAEASSPSGSERVYRAAKQELRTLALLGVPWAPRGARGGGAKAIEGEQALPMPVRAEKPAGGEAVSGAAAGSVRTPSASESSTGPVGPQPGRTVVEPKVPAADPAASSKAGRQASGAGAEAESAAVKVRAGTTGKTKTSKAAAASIASGSKADRLAALRERYERESVVARQIEGWHKIVFGDGDPDAKLMFVGEAPGEDEDLQGLPFVGRAGKKLNEMIVAMGQSRDRVYIANVLKVRPPNNRTPTVEEAELDGPFLLEQIQIVQPAVIVTLGKPATQYLLNDARAMGVLRGTWHEHAGIPVMPTYHPAYLLRAYTPENRQKVWSDLQQVVAKLAAIGA